MRSCENNSIAYDKTRRYRTLPDLGAGGFIYYFPRGILEAHGIVYRMLLVFKPVF